MYVELPLLLLLLIDPIFHISAAQVVHGASDEVVISGGHDQCLTCAPTCDVAAAAPVVHSSAAQVVHGASDEVLISGGHDQCVKIWDCRSRSIDPIQIMRHFKVGSCDTLCPWGGGGGNAMPAQPCFFFAGCK
jgi:hypothetical protein